jgi:hypothetical protein
MCAADLFSYKLVPPKREPCILFSEDGLGVSKKGSEDALRRTLTYFVINKSVPAKIKKSANRPTKNRGFRVIFVLSGLM